MDGSDVETLRPRVAEGRREDREAKNRAELLRARRKKSPCSQSEHFSNTKTLSLFL